jgi:hypothetical protein
MQPGGKYVLEKVWIWTGRPEAASSAWVMAFSVNGQWVANRTMAMTTTPTNTAPRVHSHVGGRTGRFVSWNPSMSMQGYEQFEYQKLAQALNMPSAPGSGTAHGSGARYSPTSELLMSWNLP